MEGLVCRNSAETAKDLDDHVEAHMSSLIDTKYINNGHTSIISDE